MNWHTVTVLSESLNLLLVAIGGGGGTVTHSRPCSDGVCITYVTG